jgi:hypothetical protein
MGTFIDLVSVLLIQVSIVCVVYPEILHNFLVYFYEIKEYNPEFKPYYIVIGIILGLTAFYLNSNSQK